MPTLDLTDDEAAFLIACVGSWDPPDALWDKLLDASAGVRSDFFAGDVVPTAAEARRQQEEDDRAWEERAARMFGKAAKEAKGRA